MLLKIIAQLTIIIEGNNMRKIHKIGIVGLSLLIASVITIYGFYFSLNKGPINCTADASMYFIEDTLKLTYTIRMNNGDGLIAMLGSLEHNNIETGKISRQTYFDYTTDRYYYHFVSTKTNKSDNDTVPDDVLAKFTPDFFIKPGEVRDFDIIPTNKSGWVFLMHSMPFFQCNNTLNGK